MLIKAARAASGRGDTYIEVPQTQDSILNR